MSTIECHQLFETDPGVGVNATTFTANGEFLVGGTTQDVRVWRVADGGRVQTMSTDSSPVRCLAASRDGRYIASGTKIGGLFVWDSTTYQQVTAFRAGSDAIWDVDFAPDYSTRIVSAHDDGVATVWEFAARRRRRVVLTLRHDGQVTGAKYSSLGNRIATATWESVRVWDSYDGRSLVQVNVQVKGCFSLLWYNDHLFVQTRDGKIKLINVKVTASTVSEWKVPNVDPDSCIALLQRGNCMAHSSKSHIAFWDITTHTHTHLIRHTCDVFAFAFSLDDSLLAIVDIGSKIVVKKVVQTLSGPGRDVVYAARMNGQHMGAAAMPMSHMGPRRAPVSESPGYGNRALVVGSDDEAYASSDDEAYPGSNDEAYPGSDNEAYVSSDDEASTTSCESSQILEIDAVYVSAVSFTVDGEHLLVGSESGVQVLRVKDGEQLAKIPGQHTRCIATSSDGRWIAVGANDTDEDSWSSEVGEVTVLDTTNYKQVLADKMKYTTIFDVNFSPDSCRLVVAATKGEKGAAIIWDIAAQRKLRRLDVGVPVYAAKYSPQGDRVAVASGKSVKVWDYNRDCLLITVKMPEECSRGLLWRKNHLFVRTEDGIINRIIAATGLIVSRSPLSDDDDSSGIALSRCGRFFACSVEKTITFWNTETNTEVGFPGHADSRCSISLSPDDQLIAFADEGDIILKDVSSLVFPCILEPELDIDSAALNAWKHGRLKNAESLLSAAISMSDNAHHVFAGRSLVRARLGRWDAALVDAEESLKFRRSVIGYIAKCVALVGKGETDRGCGLCDIAFLHFTSDQVSLLLLVKVIVLFMAEKHISALSRMNGLITGGWVDPALNVVQGYMHFSLGNKHMESGDYERAIQSFEDAQVKLDKRTRQPPLIVSLITGWEFGDLTDKVQRSLCKAKRVRTKHNESKD